MYRHSRQIKLSTNNGVERMKNQGAKERSKQSCGQQWNLGEKKILVARRARPSRGAGSTGRPFAQTLVHTNTHSHSQTHTDARTQCATLACRRRKPMDVVALVRSDARSLASRSRSIIGGAESRLAGCIRANKKLAGPSPSNSLARLEGRQSMLGPELEPALTHLGRAH